nr:MAG TPA: hypothetical protein [Caudoviricetes sp.]
MAKQRRGKALRFYAKALRSFAPTRTVKQRL